MNASNSLAGNVQRTSERLLENETEEAADLDGNRELPVTAATATELVHAAVAAKGRITFAEFMEIALYAPGVGYYTASPHKSAEESSSATGHASDTENPIPVLHTGPPHDYYTAPQLHPVFGAYLARHVEQIWRRLGEPQRFDVVEMGAGRGILAWDILKGLRRHAPRCWERTHYQLLDRGAGPNVEQQQALATAAAQPIVMGQAPSPPVVGVVLSNEFVDAQPVHRLRVKGGALEEIYVTTRDGRLCEVYGAPSCPELAAYLERLGWPPEGWHGEVCLAALAWLESVAHVLAQGAVITIDYGATWEELCSTRWIGGTVACYYRHRVGRNPFDRIGSQDITAHANFSALMQHGEALGLQTASLQSQAEYLMALGIGEELVALSAQPVTAETIRTKRAITDLIWPDGLGGFRVLVQEKGAQ